MTAAVAPSTSHLRIAITSPDILARIRQVFASKGLAVEIERLPYVEVTVSRPAGAAPADPSAVGDALHRLVRPADRPADRGLCAEYRLAVLPGGDHPRLALTLAPDPDADPADPADRVAALSQRQREVMDLVSRGARNADIAARLRVSEKTVKNHINQIFGRLGARSRVEAVLIWQRGQRGSAPPSTVPTALTALPAPTALAAAALAG
jgi:DNA-binding CsgD family transcriptional regulator